MIQDPRWAYLTTNENIDAVCELVVKTTVDIIRDSGQIFGLYNQDKELIAASVWATPATDISFPLPELLRQAFVTFLKTDTATAQIVIRYYTALNEFIDKNRPYDSWMLMFLAARSDIEDKIGAYNDVLTDVFLYADSECVNIWAFITDMNLFPQYKKFGFELYSTASFNVNSPHGEPPVLNAMQRQPISQTFISFPTPIWRGIFKYLRGPFEWGPMRMISKGFRKLVDRHFDFEFVPVLDNVITYDYRRREKYVYTLLQEISNEYPTCKSFDFSHLSSFGNDFLTSDVLYNLPGTLIKLVLPLENISLDIVGVMSSLPMLQILQVGQLNDASVKYLPRTVHTLSFSAASEELSATSFKDISKNIRHLTIHGSMKKNFLTDLLYNLNEIEELHIYNSIVNEAFFPSFEELNETVFSSLHSLSLYDLKNPDYSKILLPTIVAPNLVTLKTNLMFSSQIELPPSILYLDTVLFDEDFYVIPPYLETLKIQAPRKSSLRLLCENLDILPTTITSLSLKNSDISDVHLILPPNLKELELDTCKNLVGAFIKDLPEIEVLHLNNLAYLNNTFLELMPSSITDLKIVRCKNLNCSGLRFSPDIKRLDLSFTKVRNPIFLPLQTNTTLKELILDDTLVTDNLFPFLPRSLEILSLKNCHITNASVNDLPQGLKLLKLRGCPRVGGEFLRNLPPSLTELDVTNTDSDSIRYTLSDLKHLPPLKTLKIILPKGLPFSLNIIKEEMRV
eukprot:TRINITY_DN4500_c0_g1_i1.p1 TRINITY_DN4500_c0_g1~~TRINITY_DN4500_c0_g1_i1.p1  ORF type:complete len:757 (+),score=120.61 TRINITY_DN4500_c0_g1_i1:58-2271(+)